MNICVVGAGGAGVVTAAVFAHLGHEVTCVDPDATRVGLLRRGRLPLSELVRTLDAAGATLRAYDPIATDNARPLLPPGVRYCESPYAAAEGVDAVVLATEWNEFRLLSLERLGNVMRRPILFDCRSFLEPARIRRHGFEYHSLGLDGSGSPRPSNGGPVLPVPAARDARPVIDPVANGHPPGIGNATVASRPGSPGSDGTDPRMEQGRDGPARADNAATSQARRAP